MKLIILFIMWNVVIWICGLVFMSGLVIFVKFVILILRVNWWGWWVELWLCFVVKFVFWLMSFLMINCKLKSLFVSIKVRVFSILCLVLRIFIILWKFCVNVVWILCLCWIFIMIRWISEWWDIKKMCKYCVIYVFWLMVYWWKMVFCCKFLFKLWLGLCFLKLFSVKVIKDLVKVILKCCLNWLKKIRFVVEYWLMYKWIIFLYCEGICLR